MYWRWTVPLNNAQIGLGAFGELQMRSREANGESHTSFLVFCTTLQMGHLVWRLSMMTLWTGFKQQNFASDETIGSNKEAFKGEDLFSKLHLNPRNFYQKQSIKSIF